MDVIYDYSEEKNKWLKDKRGISFEEIINAIYESDPLLIQDNESIKHKDQKILVINLNGYPCVVPFVEKDNVRFLKTAFLAIKYKLLFKNK